MYYYYFSFSILFSVGLICIRFFICLLFYIPTSDFPVAQISLQYVQILGILCISSSWRKLSQSPWPLPADLVALYYWSRSLTSLLWWSASLLGKVDVERRNNPSSHSPAPTVRNGCSFWRTFMSQYVFILHIISTLSGYEILGRK